MRHDYRVWGCLLFAVLISLTISACTALEIGQATPAQALYAVEADYTAAVEGAAAFRVFCDDKPAEDPCKAIVTRMQLAQASAKSSLEIARALVSDGASDDEILFALGLVREGVLALVTQVEEGQP